MTGQISSKIANGGIIAAAMVVGIHVCNSRSVGTLMWWWDQLLHYGLFLVAVPFFFVCSGYFLCRHYADLEKAGHEVERRGGGGQWWLNFLCLMGRIRVVGVRKR